MQNLITIEPIKTEEAVRETEQVLTFLSGIETFSITTQQEYDDGAVFLNQIKNKYKILDAKRKEITKPIDVTKARIMDLFRPPLEKLKRAEEIVKKIMSDYDDIQEQILIEQEEKLRKQAEAEETRKRKDLNERAERWAEKGKEEKAEGLREQAESLHIEAPILAPRTEKPKGISYRDHWTAEVVDFGMLPDEYKFPNMPMLNRVAQATKGQLPIPGVIFHSKKIVASRI